MTDDPSQRPGPTDEEIAYWKPGDVPPNLTPMDRAIIAARNVRAWADWLLQTGPAPEQGDQLVDVGGREDGGA